MKEKKETNIHFIQFTVCPSFFLNFHSMFTIYKWTVGQTVFLPDERDPAVGMRFQAEGQN